VNDRSLKDANYFATYSEGNTDGVAKYDIVERLLELQNKADMFRGNDAESFLETLLSDVTVDVNKTEISSTNYSNIATVISTQRTSVSGVDEDEEALNLIKFQNAYNLASKVISVMAELYDKLINETGVT
jgi:flagellar hook-associated protein 1 FlgK